MANDFYSKMISGFAQGLGLGGQNHRISALKRGENEREKDALALFGELIGQDKSTGGNGEGNLIPLPHKEAILASLAPAIFSLYKSHRKKKRKTGL
ncbi:MAG: hypothetical protein IPJ75_02325 [Ignavibacteriales bacterium]|nr:hypothetical protein [Ignavibacteriales bacterium]